MHHKECSEKVITIEKFCSLARGLIEDKQLTEEAQKYGFMFAETIKDIKKRLRNYSLKVQQSCQKMES